MTRSLSIPYLFVILAVGYLGGTLLFRELSEESIASLLTFYDARIVKPGEATILLPALVVMMFLIISFFLSRFTYSRLFVLLIGAIKCVLFGLSSAYLLAKGLKVYEYAVWWFPFQLLLCFLLLLFASILTPPFFMKTTGKRERNDRALVALLIITILIVLVENLIYVFWIS